MINLILLSIYFSNILQAPKKELHCDIILLFIYIYHKSSTHRLLSIRDQTVILIKVERMSFILKVLGGALVLVARATLAPRARAAERIGEERPDREFSALSASWTSTVSRSPGGLIMFADEERGEVK